MIDFKHMIEIIDDPVLTRDDKLALLSAIKVPPKYTDIDEIEGIPYYYLTPVHYLLDFIEIKPEILTYAFDFDILDLLRCKLKINRHIADQLEAATGFSGDVWLNLQNTYNRNMEKAKEINEMNQ